MASAYPGGLDNFATNKTDATVTPTDHPEHHNDLADAVNKIEAELGVDPAGASATVVARLALLDTPAAVRLVDHLPSGVTPNAFDDEFTSDTTGDYTTVTPSGSSAFSIAAGRLTGQTVTTTSAADIIGFVKAGTLAIGESLETYIQLTALSVNYTVAAIILAEGTATGDSLIGAGYYAGATNKITAWSVTGTYTSYVDGLVGAQPLDCRFVRVRRADATTYQPEYSSDGVVWTTLGAAAITYNDTVAFMGVAVSSFAANMHLGRSQWSYLRVI